MKRILLLSLLIFTVVSCDRPCNRLAKHMAVEQRLAAYHKWRTSLDFMDDNVIGESREYLENSIANTASCIPFDSTLIQHIDLVSNWYGAHSPSSDDIKRAEFYLDSIKVALRSVADQSSGMNF